MLTDLQIALLLQAQYDGAIDCFDIVNRIKDVSFAIKKYEDCTVICFEGSYNAADWWSNFKAEMIQVGGLGGVEKGFYDGMPDILNAIYPVLDKEKPVICAGHSRGSAHADIFSAIMIALNFRVIIVVFGSPHPGDHVLAALIMKCLARRSYKNRNDPVTTWPIPLLIPYWPYIAPNPPISVNEAPPPDDKWLLLADHHFKLYVKALQNGQSQTPK